MALTRATLLLFFLPALVPAAPAPLPRVRKPRETGGWSKPVDGLRVRLVARQRCFRVGDAVRLMLELQNVSDKPLEIEDPELWPSISGSGRSGWAIIGQKRDRQLREHEVIDQWKGASTSTRLRPGATLRIEITA